MRLPRMTTRRWIIAVAGVATALGFVQAIRLERRRVQYQEAAQLFAALEARLKQSAASHSSLADALDECVGKEVRLSASSTRAAVDVRISEPLERMPGAYIESSELPFVSLFRSLAEQSAAEALRHAEDAVEQRAVAAAAEREAAYYLRLKQKYEWAARRPWLSVSPDPPPPK